jgi:glucose/arabinose dehydrogenase
MSRRALVITGAALVAVLAIGTGLAWYLGLIFNKPTVRAGSPLAVPSEAIETVATRLEAPWGLAFLPDRTALVTERDSVRILSIVAPDVGTTPDVAAATKVTEVQRITDARPGGEGGLLGIAVSPTYATDRWVYIYYTAADDNRIARLRLGEAPQPILTGIPKAGNHNGGRIAFGPDGMLYVGTGDATDRGSAPDRASLSGKILRLTPEGRPAPGNPFPGSPVYTSGHRNVQGLAWDDSGQLYATEFGQNRYDELNRIEAGGDYGWPAVEGVGDDPAYINPVATWSTSDASPSGLAIVDGRAYLACLRGTKLYRIGLDGNDAQALLSNEYGRLRAAEVAPDGTLWVLTSNRDGRGSPDDADDRILRLNPARIPT